jgi:hypothetical protein
MEALNSAVDDWVAIITGVIAIYFFVSLVVNLAQAQLSTATGDVIGHAHALQQAIAMVILLAVAASAKTLVPALQSYISPEIAPKTNSEAISIWRGIAHFVVSVVIGGIGIVTTVSAVYSALGAQLSAAIGKSRAISELLVRLVVLVSGGLLTIGSIGLANWLLSHIL